MWAGHSKSVRGPLSVQGGLGLSTDGTARVMKAGPKAPAPGKGLCAWRLSQRRALQDTEPNQKLWDGSFPKMMRVKQKPERVLFCWSLRSKENGAVIIAYCSPKCKGHGPQDWEGSSLPALVPRKQGEGAGQPRPAPEVGSSSSLGRPGSHSQASFCSKKAAHICKWQVFFYYVCNFF